MHALGLESGSALYISSPLLSSCHLLHLLNLRFPRPLTAAVATKASLGERDVACHARGRPAGRGRKDLPYIRKMSRDKQKEWERREAGIVDEVEEESFESDDPQYLEELRRASVGLGKLRIESNGPPMLVLHPYISEEKPVDERSLRPLPVTSPQMLRPSSLPKPSLRRRLGIFSSKKNAARGVDSFMNLAEDIRDLPDEAEVAEALDKWAWKLSKGALSKTVKDLGRMQLTERILQVLLWLQKHPHLWPDDITVCAMIHVMVEAGESEIALQLQRGVGRDSVKAAQTLASALAKAGMLEEAVEVINYMKSSGWKIDGYVYTTITQWACRTGSRDVANWFWSNVDLSDLSLRLPDYIAIMASCSKLGLFGVIERLYQHFIASGLQPNVVMYTTLISILTRRGKYREAAAFFWEMEEAGCEPDLMAYEVMLEVCSKLQDLNKGLKVYRDVKNAGYTPTPGFYNTLIQLVLKKGSLSTARGIIREMSSVGHTPSGDTLACLSAAAASSA